MAEGLTVQSSSSLTPQWRSEPPLRRRIIENSPFSPSSSSSTSTSPAALTAPNKPSSSPAPPLHSRLPHHTLRLEPPEALITAELSTALPGNGGFVLWTHRAFGPFPGFLIGTWKFLSGAINSATYPALSADYVARNIPSISSGTPRAIAVSATTILISFLNYTMPTVLQFFQPLFCNSLFYIQTWFVISSLYYSGASEASTNQFRDIARAIVQSSRHLSIFFMDRPFKFFMDRPFKFFMDRQGPPAYKPRH